MTNVSIVYFGTPTFSAVILEQLVADFEKVPVGWDIMDKPLYTQSFSGDYMVPFKELPPAPPPPPGTPAPTRIAAPKAALD